MSAHRAALFLILSMAVAQQAGAEDAARQAEVRARGPAVMPFALERTLHVFEKTTQGGIQRVVARPGGEAEVPQIRRHLREIAARFAQRDFSAPEQLHGAAMPGLAALREAPPGDLTIEYREHPEGAEIVYVAATDALRRALHAWFEAQVHDHGHDATHHHAG
jgi:hypothetical protein